MSKKLIIIEGPDGVGKSTISDELVSVYLNRDISCKKIIQPNSNGPLGFIRPIVKTDADLQPFERQLLHVVTHIQDLHTEFTSDIMIMDRSLISSFVYSEANEEFPISRLELLRKIQIEPHINYFLDNDFEIMIFLITNDKSFRDIEEEGDAYSSLKFDRLRNLYFKHTPQFHIELGESGVKCLYCEVENLVIDETVNYILSIIDNSQKLNS